MKKIGIMGGTFNPIHNAHIALALNAYRQYELDEVVFLPSKCPPHKVGQDLASETDRLNMIKYAIDGYKYFKVWDLELKREGVTYTVDTLEELQTLDEKNEYFFIIGGDSLFNFHTWKHPKRILELCNLIVCGRNDSKELDIKEKIQDLKQTFGGNIFYMYVEPMNISSSSIRESIRNQDMSLDSLPRLVKNYIDKNKVYS